MCEQLAQSRYVEKRGRPGLEPIHIYSYKNLKQELKTVKVNSEKHTQVYGMYRAV